jgi:putative colanic acid biosynthesis acetyltransferase WcaF
MTMILNAKERSRVEGSGASFTILNRLERLAWRTTWLLLARWTPPMFSLWRIQLLKLFGARVAPGAMIGASTNVWLPRHLMLGQNSSLAPGVNCYSMAPITIGARTIISQGAHLCAGSHDVSDPNFQLIAKPITIGEDVWIAAEAFVGPGVTVENGAVLAARACAFSDLQPWTIYRGNPAVPLRVRNWQLPEDGGPKTHAPRGRSVP